MKTIVFTLSLLTALLQISNGQAVVSSRDDPLYVKGLAAQESKDYESALRFFKDVEARLPVSEDIIEKVGTCYLDLEQYPEAVRHYRSGLVKFPDSSMLQNNLAVAYRLNQQYDEAIEVYKKIVAANPEDDGAWFFLGASYMASKQNFKAEDAFLRSSAITPDWAGTWFNLGIVCQREGKDAPALMHYSRALSLDPKDSKVWDNFRGLMLEKGPHSPYVDSWINAPPNADFEFYLSRAKKKVEEAVYSMFPNLRDPNDPMRAALRAEYRRVQRDDPKFARGPNVLMFCAIIAAEQNGIAPVLAEPSGAGELTIQNGSDSDALVKVVSLVGPNLWQEVVVTAGGIRKVDKVPNGHFLVFFAMADKIDPETREFSGNPRASKFEKSIAFTTSSKLQAQSIVTSTTSYSLTLHPVIGGNAKTETITIAEFNKY